MPVLGVRSGMAQALRCGLLLVGLGAVVLGCGGEQAIDRDLPVLQGVEFVGNSHFGPGELRAQMLLEFPSLLHPLRPHPRFRRNAFPNDLRRVQAFYRRHGFGGASAWVDTVVSEGRSRSARLVVRVREGPQTLIHEVRFLPQPVFTLEELSRVSPFAPGDPYPFNPTLLGRATRALRLAFLSRGYLAVGVRDSTILSADSTEAVLIYGFDPGQQFTVRAVGITGNKGTKQDLVRRELRIEPGQVYSYTRIQESQQNLYNTALFRGVTITEDTLDLTAHTVDIAVKVAERQMAYFEGSIGLGYRTDPEARLSAAWGHRNLFGRGHAVDVRSTLAYDLKVQKRNYLLEESVRYTQPHLFGSNVRVSPEVSYTFDRRVLNVEIRRLQVDVEASRRTGRYTTLALGAVAAFTTTKADQSQITDDLLQTRALSMTVSRNSTDNLFNPRRGGAMSVSAQSAGLGGDNYFTRASGSWFHYLPFRSSVLVVGLRTGWVEANGRSRSAEAAHIGIRGVPFEYLFQAGGNTTVRGFEANGLGTPVTATRRTVEGGIVRQDTLSSNAGTVLVVGNVEFRSPLPGFPNGPLGFVLFLDAGNTWEDFGSFKSAPFGVRYYEQYSGGDDMRYSYGLGLRYATPLGPVRLDLGFKMKRWAHGLLHIGLGHTF